MTKENKFPGMALPVWGAIFIFAVTTSAIPKFASAKEVCSMLDSIITSGLDANRPFASVDDLIFSTAVTCYVEHDGTQSFYICNWGLGDEKREEMEDLKDEFKDKYDSLGEDRHEALENFDHEELALIETERYNLTLEFVSNMTSIIGGSAASFIQKNKLLYSNLIKSLDECFNSGAIQNADEYRFREYHEDHVYWERLPGCRVAIEHEGGKYLGSEDEFDRRVFKGVELRVLCPS